MFHLDSSSAGSPYSSISGDASSPDTQISQQSQPPPPPQSQSQTKSPSHPLSHQLHSSSPPQNQQPIPPLPSSTSGQQSQNQHIDSYTQALHAKAQAALKGGVAGGNSGFMSSMQVLQQMGWGQFAAAHLHQLQMQEQQQKQQERQEQLQRQSISPPQQVFQQPLPQQTQRQPQQSQQQQQQRMAQSGQASSGPSAHTANTIAGSLGTSTGAASGSGVGAGVGVGVGAGPGGSGLGNGTGSGFASGSGSGLTTGLPPPGQGQAVKLESPAVRPPNFSTTSQSKPNQSSNSAQNQVNTVTTAPPTTASLSRATSLGLDNGSTSASASSAPPPMPTASERSHLQIQSRSEPPKRLIDIDMLPVQAVPLDEMKGDSSRTVLVLQGDPQIITKQRVETAIRVILDILRAIPPQPSVLPLSPALIQLLPPDATMTNISFERPSNFRSLRLQAGTTTKAIAKKQLQAARTPDHETLYLETAVYMSGDDGRRVYACKRCRLREERRRANKDAARKKLAAQQSSGSDTSSSQRPVPVGIPGAPAPSEDYITGANAEQYDPHQKAQVVEEPMWDPKRADWRHEIVLFNSAPEVPIQDGSCMWLPFRVICYGKCHGEKLGFRIKFVLRTSDGTIIATSFTDPIRITDDHKTDTKAKPKVEGMTSTAQPAVPRGRKARASASAASSRRQSPAPSEGESVQSLSEAGAVLQKQTPNVRSRPYDRPPSQSPATTTGNLPFDLVAAANANAAANSNNGQNRPDFRRQQSTSSLHSVGSFTQLSSQFEGMDGFGTGSEFPSFGDAPVGNTVSPGALRRPNFSFTALDGLSGYQNSASRPHSATSSNVASPVTGLRPLGDDMMLSAGHDGLQSPRSLTSAFADMGGLHQNQNQNQNQPIGVGVGVGVGLGVGSGGNQMMGQQMLSDYLADQEMANTLTTAMDGLFDVSSAASLASSFNDAASNSAFSAFQDGASGFYSESGLVPEDSSMEMEGFLDFSGGEDQNLSHPAFGVGGNGATSPEPPGGASVPPLPFDLDMGVSSPNAMSPNGHVPSHMSSRGMNGMSMGMGMGMGMGGNLYGSPQSHQQLNDNQAQIQDILSSFSQRQNDPSAHSPTSITHGPMSPVAHTNQVGQMHSQQQPQQHVQQPQQQQQQQQANIFPHNMNMPQIPPQPLVSHVIPAEGPMAGGTQVAVAGQRFSPGMTIMFGSRVAKTTVVSDSFCTCELPPAAEPGLVEVAVQGALRKIGDKIETFRYLGMDKEMMRLALEVRDQYQGSSSDAAYRLAQRIAQTSRSNSGSEQSSASPMGSNNSPGMFMAAETALLDKKDKKDETDGSDEDLQTTVIDFLSSLDETAPGSLRKSGAVNHRNKAEQTLLHLATVMGFHQLVRRLILIGAQLDLQDANGFTPLAFASLCGQVTCARVLIEAGASYDRPTAFGEMPLDLAKLGEKKEVEMLLLSAVWSTNPPKTEAGTPAGVANSVTTNTDALSEIDEDNPSSDSDVDEEAARLRNVKAARRRKSKSKGKQRAGPTSVPLPSSSPRRSLSAISLNLSRGVSPLASPQHHAASVPADDPPPYEPSRTHTPVARQDLEEEDDSASWMSRTLSNISHHSGHAAFKSFHPQGMWNRLPLPSLWHEKASAVDQDGNGIATATGTTGDTANAPTRTSSAHQHDQGWIALPAPSWETLSKMTSPEEVKLFTQAMAAAALSAVVQSTGGGLEFGQDRGSRERRRSERGGRSGGKSSGSGSGSGTTMTNAPGSGGATVLGQKGERAPSRRGSKGRDRSEGEREREQVKNVVQHVKQDRMLYLFWLPILLFVGFWLLVTALPIATGFGLIYARQITRAIKQRM